MTESIQSKIDLTKCDFEIVFIKRDFLKNWNVWAKRIFVIKLDFWTDSELY